MVWVFASVHGLGAKAHDDDLTSTRTMNLRGDSHGGGCSGEAEFVMCFGVTPVYVVPCSLLAHFELISTFSIAHCTSDSALELNNIQAAILLHWNMSVHAHALHTET